MSWWFTESIAKTPDGKTLLASFEADDTSIFPNVVQYKVDPTTHLPTGEIDYTIARGSVLYCLSNSKTYKLNSSGQWVEQKSGQEIEISADDIVYDNTDSGLTATNVQDAIDELKDNDDMQDRALAELYGEDANQQLEINYAINTGSKNVLKITGSTQTISGITFTVNEDQTITVNGTATSTATFVVTNNATAIQIPDGQYILSGCPSGGGNSTYDLRWYLYSTGSSAYDYGSGASISKTGNTTTSNIAIIIRSGQTVNNLTFKPMVRSTQVANGTFQPYAPTNRELYEISQTKADKGTFDLTIAGSPLVASEYSYSCIVTGDIVTICVRIILAEELAVNTSRNLFFIPSPYYPPVPCAGAGYADGKVRTFWVNQYGTIKIRIDEAIPAGANLNANFCYSYKTGNWTTVTANQLQSLNSPLTLNLNRNDLNEQLDTNFDLIDSIPEEEEGEEDD